MKIEKDTSLNPKFESRCELCVWYLGDKECPAYNGKIPEKIWKGVHDTITDDQDLKVKYEPKGDIL